MNDHEYWLFWFGQYCNSLWSEDRDGDLAVKEVNALAKREGLSMMDATMQLAEKRPYLFREPDLRTTPMEHLDSLVIAKAQERGATFEQVQAEVEAAFPDLVRVAQIQGEDSRGFVSTCRTLGGVKVAKEELLAEFVKRYDQARKRQEQKEDRIIAEMLSEEERRCR